MKIIEVEIDEQSLEELNLSTGKIAYSDLRKKIARAEALKALRECNRIAKEEGLDKMNEEEIQNIVREARAHYGKSGN